MWARSSNVKTLLKNAFVVNVFTDEEEKKKMEQLQQQQESIGTKFLKSQENADKKPKPAEPDGPSTNGLGISDEKYEESIKKSLVSKNNNYLVKKVLEKMRAGDKKAREELINGNLRLVLSIIQSFRNRGENPDDLFQVGCIGLIKAVDHFDSALGLQFTTYAYPMVVGEVRRFLRDSDVVRVIFADRRRTDPDEFPLFAQLFDCGRAAVPHPRAEPADQLIDVRAQFPLIRHAPLDPFGN